MLFSLKKPDIVLPRLNFEQEDEVMKKQYGILQQTEFKMEVAFNASQSDAKLFPSLSHFIYNKIAHAESEIKAFNVENIRDGILLALSICKNVSRVVSS
jgi:hypothetical protein